MLPADQSTMVLLSELELRNILLSVNYTIKTLIKEVEVNNDLSNEWMFWIPLNEQKRNDKERKKKWLNDRLAHRHTDDWLMDRWTVELVDWRKNGQTDELTGGLTDWLTDSDWLTLTDWLTDGQNDWLTNELTDTDWITDRLMDRMTDWMTDWLILTDTDRLMDRMTDWMTDWLTDWQIGKVQ